LKGQAQQFTVGDRIDPRCSWRVWRNTGQDVGTQSLLGDPVLWGFMTVRWHRFGDGTFWRLWSQMFYTKKVFFWN